MRVGQALTSAVVRLEDAKRLAVLADNFPANSPNPSADFVGWSDEELTGRQLLHQDFGIGAVSEALNPMRKSHHVAVADSPDLYDLHRREYTRVYTTCQVHRASRVGGSLEGDGWVNWSGLATLLATAGAALQWPLDRCGA